MRDAILSSGGVPGVNVALCETVQVPTVLSSNIEGISQLSNVEYEEEGLLVSRAYGIGDGKLILTDKLYCPSPSDLRTLTGVTRSYSSAFTSVMERRIKASVRDPDPPVHIEEEDSNVAIFSCAEEGCVKTFERYSSMRTVENTNVLLSDILYWRELLLDMLKGLRGNAKLFPSWTQ